MNIYQIQLIGIFQELIQRRCYLSSYAYESKSVMPV